MRHKSLALFVVTSAVLAMPSISAGQEPAVRTSVAVAGGAAFDSRDTGPSLGGTITLDLSSRFAVEGSGAYLGRGPGADAFSLQAGLLANLAPRSAQIIPFIAAGAGIYRASFDLAAERFFGGAGAQFGPGMALCAGTGVCPYGNMPAFYGRRLGAVSTPAAGAAWPTRTFTDPAFHMAAGARIPVTTHVLIRPEIRGLFVVANSTVHSIGALSVGLGYEF